MFAPKSFLYALSDGIATITLNRPERLNAITFEVYHELTDFFGALREEKAVRVVVITGAGRAFCSGGDVRDIIGELQGRDAEGLLEFTRLTCELIRNMRQLPKPIIASLNGTTAGAGSCIALASDIRIAAEHAKFGISEVKRGILPGNGGTQRALRHLPYPIAMEMLLLGDQISAQQALQYGLINKVGPKEELMPAAQDYARRLSQNPPLAVRAIKELAVRSQYMHINDGLRLESAIGSVLRQTEDAKEGPRAFAEKRPPVFRGR